MGLTLQRECAVPDRKPVRSPLYQQQWWLDSGPGRWSRLWLTDDGSFASRHAESASSAAAACRSQARLSTQPLNSALWNQHLRKLSRFGARWPQSVLQA